MEIFFGHLVVARPTHSHIIMVIETTFNDFTVGNAEGSATSAKKYFVIKRTLFALKKKFMTANNRRRHY